MIFVHKDQFCRNHVDYIRRFGFIAFAIIEVELLRGLLGISSSPFQRIENNH